MNNDLISREDLKKKLQARHDNGEEDFDKGYNIGIETAIDLIDNAPTVEPDKLVTLKDAYQEGHYDGYLEGYTKAINEERPQGEWKVDGCLIACNKCGRILLKASELYNFCPNCGADMRKGGAE